MRRESFHHHGIAGSVRLDARHAECLHPGLKGRAHMDILLQQVINGLVLGSMYALIALGYTMVYGIIQLINFAHGEVLMVGALTSWSCIGLMQEAMRSEEHTSELQSQSNLVCRLLLEKKKKKNNKSDTRIVYRNKQC